MARLRQDHALRWWVVTGLAVVLIGGAFRLPGTQAAPPTALSPVAAPIPGAGPFGMATTENRVFIADNQADRVRSYGIDPATGLLTLVGSVSVPGGPSSVAVVPGGNHAVVTSLRSGNVSSYAIDRNTGTLSPVGVTSSGGAGPSDAAITDEGFVIIPNQDANNVGVVKIDKSTGTLSPVGAVPAGAAPAVVKVAGTEAIVGHARSNEVRHLRIDRSTGTLSPVGAVPLGERVTSVDVAPGGQRWAVGTISGQVHIYEMVSNQFTRRWSGPTGGDLWDLAFSDANTLYTVGVTSNRVAAFDLSAGNFRQTAAWTIPGERSTRSIVVVPGVGKTFLIVSEFNGNRSWVIGATP